MYIERSIRLRVESLVIQKTDEARQFCHSANQQVKCPFRGTLGCCKHSQTVPKDLPSICEEFLQNIFQFHFENIVCFGCNPLNPSKRLSQTQKQQPSYSHSVSKDTPIQSPDYVQINKASDNL